MKHPHENPPVLSKAEGLGAIAGLLSAGTLAFFCIAVLHFSDNYNSVYGYAMFVILPIFAGAVAGLIANRQVTTSATTVWTMTLLMYFMIMVVLMCFAIEGLVCLVMSMPIGMPCIAGGAFISRAVLDSRRNKTLMVSFLPILCVAGLVSCVYNPGPASVVETTTMIIDAPPETIWPYLFKLESLPEPSHWALKTGVAYPVKVDSAGRFEGASRQCVLSTGVMEERISRLETNRLLRFEVISTPPPLKETNPFGEVHAPHDHGYYQVKWGEFRLEPLPGGRTLVTGTSSYQYNLYPAWYWKLITNTVVEQIHVHVMREIKRRGRALDRYSVE